MTALDLTVQPATRSVLLEVTDAPSPEVVYETDFPTDLDSWTEVGDAGATWFATDDGVVLVVVPAAATPGHGIERALTGLEIGVDYRVTLTARVSQGPAQTAVLSVAGKPDTDTTTSYNVTTTLVVEFTATATSHTIQLLNGETVDASSDHLLLYDATVQALPGDYTGPTVITRTDANGVNPVRLLAGQEPIAGSLAVVDYEPALTGLVRYDVTDSEGALTTASTTLDGGPGGPVLSVAVLPQYRETPRMIHGYGAEATSSGTVHEVVGRDDYVPVLGILRTRRGTLDALVDSHADALALAGLYGLGEVVLLRQPDHAGLDMWHVAERVSWRPDSRRWTVTVAYVEVAVPPDPLLGALGWTVADVAAAYPTVAAVVGLYETVADLTLGPM